MSLQPPRSQSVHGLPTENNIIADRSRAPIKTTVQQPVIKNTEQLYSLGGFNFNFHMRPANSLGTGCPTAGWRDPRLKKNVKAENEGINRDF